MQHAFCTNAVCICTKCCVFLVLFVGVSDDSCLALLQGHRHGGAAQHSSAGNPPARPPLRRSQCGSRRHGCPGCTSSRPPSHRTSTQGGGTISHRSSDLQIPVSEDRSHAAGKMLFLVLALCLRFLYQGSRLCCSLPRLLQRALTGRPGRAPLHPREGGICSARPHKAL